MSSLMEKLVLTRYLNSKQVDLEFRHSEKIRKLKWLHLQFQLILFYNLEIASFSNGFLPFDNGHFFAVSFV